MLRKLRRRLILSSLFAILLALCLLLAALNISNHMLVNQRLDRTLERLAQSEPRAPFPELFPREDPMERMFGECLPSPEVQYMTRFFKVVCDGEGNVLEVYTDFIASVSEEEAQEYAAVVLRRSRTSGYYGDYRYLVQREDGQSQVIFLNATNELQFQQTLLFVSAAVAAGMLLLIFILLLPFSKRALAPYLRNIQRQKQFITDASHELKTPITSISTSAAVLAIEDGENEWLQNIQRQTTRLSRLVQDLVTLSRLDEDSPLPEKQDFSLSGALWEAAEPFERMAQAKGLHYSQKIENDLRFRGDKALIQQLFSILLDNALRYTEADGWIRLELSRKHRSCCIQISNSCRLENTRDLERLFDRFYRLDSSRSSHTGGSGVGLSIAKSIVEAHGGRISVQSRDGKSILFQVLL